MGGSYPNVSLRATPRETAQAINYLLNNQKAVSPLVATPFDYGAVGDGVTDDAAAILAAIEGGDEVDGLGLTYGLSGQVSPTSAKGLRNARFVWLGSSAMTAQQYMLHFQELNDFWLDNLWFDLGNIADTGQYDDSTRGGLSIGVAVGNELTHFNTQVSLRHLRCTGMGNGTAFNVRNVDRGTVQDIIVHDRKVAYSAGPNGNPPNDDQDGLDLTRCRNVNVSNVNVYNGLSLFDGSYTNYRGRGIVVTSTSDTVLTNIHVSTMSQGFDFSGGDDLGGNRGLALSNCSASDVFEWGFKFVHGIKDCVASNLIARRFGDGGFVFMTDAGTTGEDVTGHLHFSNCHVFDPVPQPNEGVGNVPETSKIGWRFLQSGTDPAMPTDVTLDNCTARDTGGYMPFGFHSEAALDSTVLMRNCAASGTASGFTEYGGSITTTNWKTL